MLEKFVKILGCLKFSGRGSRIAQCLGAAPPSRSVQVPAQLCCVVLAYAARILHVRAPVAFAMLAEDLSQDEM